jgi:hypothetical protein
MRRSGAGGLFDLWKSGQDRTGQDRTREDKTRAFATYERAEMYVRVK